jgi:hypothetical protein
MRTRRIGAVLLGLGLVVAGVGGPGVVAQAAPVARAAHVSAAEQAAALRYWTPERLASAVDLDAQVVAAPDGSARPETRGTPYSVPAALPATGAPAGGPAVHPDASSPQRWTSGGLISTTTGKVFFSNSSGSWACSGDAVNSGNKSIVATAGHCVVDAGTGEVYQNWVFIPGYDHGNRPHGTFTASSLHWMAQRIGNSDPTWDAAFATMSPLNGTRLVDAVGGEGIGFDQTPGQYVYSFGYGGSDAEGNGEQLNWCAGTEVFESGHPGGGIWGIDCIQTGGSSGGPFLQNFNASDGTGTQIGNISVYGSGREWHPYYGWEAHDAYNAADAA